MVEIKLMNYDVSSDFKNIYINTVNGKTKISYADAFEIAWGFLDAVGALDNYVEEKLVEADKEYHLDKF